MTSIAHRERVEGAIDQVRVGRFQMLTLAIIIATLFLEGFANQLMGAVMPQLIEDWQVTPSFASAAVAANWAGVVVGTLLGGFAADRIGRRPMMLFALLFFGGGTVATPLVSTIPELAVLRFLVGLGVGSSVPPSLALASEITPRRLRGRTIGIAMFGMSMGTVACGLAGSAMIPGFGWLWFATASGAVPLMLLLLAAVLLPESPAHLVRYAHHHPRLSTIMARIGVEAQAWQLADGFQKGPNESDNVREGLLDKFIVKSRMYRIFAMWGILLTSFFIAASILNWSATLFVNEGLTIAEASIAPSTWAFGAMLAPMIAGWISEKLGLRNAIIGFAMLAVIAVLCIPVAANAFGNGNIFMFSPLLVGGFSLTGLGTCLFAMTTLIYPAQARSSGLGIARTLAQLGAFFSSAAGFAVGSASLFFGLMIAAVFAVAAIALPLAIRGTRDV